MEAALRLTEPRLDAARLRGFLDSPALRAADGRVLSWLNASHPGYAYEEATALLARLKRSLGEPDGELEGLLRRTLDRRWLGRDGVRYAFDTGLALPFAADPHALAAELAEQLEAGAVCSPVSHPQRWSQRLGPHLLKIAPELARAGQSEAAARLVERVLRTCWTGSRFAVHPGGPTYVHGHCYALEGLVGLGLRPDVVRAGVDWLARQQRADGSLPAWVAGGELRWPADAVAQAVRLWSAVDRRAYDLPIRRALALLVRRQALDGGIAYGAERADRNAWTSMFALQAARWAERPPDRAAIRWLV